MHLLQPFYSPSRDPANWNIQWNIINGEIQKLMFNKRQAFKKMIKNPTPENKYLYSKFRNRVVSEDPKLSITKIILKSIKLT